ncbi:MAG: hemerythrin domain-containing protein [Chitinophagaceae bacterium]
MNDHVPIKRHQALVSFSKEHHFGLLLVWKIRQGLLKAVSAERIGKYVLFFFKEDLETHFREEEQLLFSKLPVTDTLRKRAEEEHKEIYSLVETIQGNSDESLLRQFADILEKHIRFEERTLFNHLQTHISAGELKEISTRFSNAVDLDSKWEDVFWIREK